MTNIVKILPLVTDLKAYDITMLEYIRDNEGVTKQELLSVYESTESVLDKDLEILQQLGKIRIEQDGVIFFIRD